MEMVNFYHGHQIVSRVDENGWTHELFPLVNPQFVDRRWAFDSVGPSVGTFGQLADAIREAKKRFRETGGE